jgi:hypothetical protein
LALSVSLSVGHHGTNLTHVALGNHGRTAQLAFTFGGLLGQDMTQVGMGALHAATTQSFEALFCATLGNL